MAPAGSKNHHAYHGGLLEHVVGLMELVLRVCPCYPQLNGDLLLMGAFLHDLGKTTELSYEHSLGYSDEGQLIGHLVMAVEMLDAKLAEAEKLSGEPVPRETVLRLKHMILSHHGEYAFGSPKLPMTLEAVALAHLDNLDAKINTFSSLMRDDPNVDSPWTTYNANLGAEALQRRGRHGRWAGRGRIADQCWAPRPTFGRRLACPAVQHGWTSQPWRPTIYVCSGESRSSSLSYASSILRTVSASSSFLFHDARHLQFPRGAGAAQGARSRCRFSNFASRRVTASMLAGLVPCR